jgi:hypothetical protein
MQPPVAVSGSVSGRFGLPSVRRVVRWLGNDYPQRRGNSRTRTEVTQVGEQTTPTSEGSRAAVEDTARRLAQVLDELRSFANRDGTLSPALVQGLADGVRQVDEALARVRPESAEPVSPQTLVAESSRG